MAIAVSEVNKAIKTSLAAEYAGENEAVHFKGKNVFLSFMGASILGCGVGIGLLNLLYSKNRESVYYSKG